MNEKIFKSLSQIGGSGIAIGIIILVTGLAAGILTIINGARTLKTKNNIMI